MHNGTLYFGSQDTKLYAVEAATGRVRWKFKAPFAINTVPAGAGDLVYFEKMDDTQVGSVQVAQAKARSAARFKRPPTSRQPTSRQPAHATRYMKRSSP